MKKQSVSAKIRALLEAGKSVKEIAAKLKVKPAAVYQTRYQMAKSEKAVRDQIVKDMGGLGQVDEKAVHEVLATPVHDPVNHPKHYTTGKIETIDYIDAKGFNYCLGNAIKYVSRAPHKGKYVEDLKKAVWYINHAIKLHEEGRG